MAKVVAIVGSYRRGGVVERTVDAVLSAAEEGGARTEKIFLPERRIEFCTNCRGCTQQAGKRRGPCPLEDDMAGILDAIEAADAVVLGSPVNFGSVTAVTQRFIERLICYAWWPWGAGAPKNRNRKKTRRAVLVYAMAAPALFGAFPGGAKGQLNRAAGVMGARTAGTVGVGLASVEEHPSLPAKALRKAERCGRLLAAGR